MKKGIKKKIFLSNLLEQIEINRDTVEIIGKLDEFHLKAKSHVIGVTGPPGAGKSSLVDKLILEIRQNKKSVGVIAIDPSSRKSGGALLGDRTRFLLDPNDNDVFVRSMAAKDFLGGLSELTFPTMTVMRSIFDYVIIETVGVGQSETNVKEVVDSVILCVQPGSGDTIQFMKSGIFEIPDIVVVTKSDIETIANLTYSELTNSKNYFKAPNDWDIEIIKTSVVKNLGLDLLFKEIQRRWLWLKKNKNIQNQRYDQDISWIKKTIMREFGTNGVKKLDKLLSYKNKPFSTVKKLKKIL
ncbi:MAG: methylmalonyl Co-A mutase-associated GTPase MeaB [Alphaproteobacteria bacterium]|nr:methylmalonyl Co-A mutase-associated GTPase MeaB [Alphaproteobacteria bacterium]